MSRVKFYAKCIGKEAPKHEEVIDLIKWCRIFGRKGYAPLLEDGGSAGNLSKRVYDGFIITRSKIGLKHNITNEHFAHVYSTFEKRIKWFEKNQECLYKASEGKPSSEASLHDAIYSWCEDVEAVFHGHYEPVLESSKEILKEFENAKETGIKRVPGTKELVEDVVEILEENPKVNFIILTGHGFISLGEDCEEAGNLAVEVCEFARRRSIS